MYSTIMSKRIHIRGKSRPISALGLYEFQMNAKCRYRPAYSYTITTYTPTHTHTYRYIFYVKTNESRSYFLSVISNLIIELKIYDEKNVSTEIL